MVVDYHRLNQQVAATNSYNVRGIFSNLHKLQGDSGKAYACLDLKQYFYQIPTSEKTKQLIAINHASFATPYTWTVSPLGISSLPQVSSTILQKIIPRELKAFIATHIDDLALAADTEEQLVDRLDILLRAFEHAGILVNAEKSILITRQIDWCTDV